MGTIAFRRKAVDRAMKWAFFLCAFLVILPCSWSSSTS